MKKKLSLFFSLVAFSFALDTSNMFFTPQPYNMYSEPLDTRDKKMPEPTDHNATKAEKESLKGKLQGGDLYFNAYMGFVVYPGYNRPGNAVTVNVEKYLPNLFPDYNGLLVEADYTLPTRANTDGHGLLPDLMISSGGLYGGYLVKINDKTGLKPKIGVVYQSNPVSGIAFAAGVSVYRKLSINIVDLAGDVSIKGNVWYINVGVRYKYQNQQ